MRGHFCVCSSFHILFETPKLTLVLCQTVCVIDEVLFVLLPLHFIPVQVPSSSTSTFQPYVPSPKCYLHPLLIINICSCLHNAWTQDIISSSIVLTDWKYFGRYTKVHMMVKILGWVGLGGLWNGFSEVVCCANFLWHLMQWLQGSVELSFLPSAQGSRCRCHEAHARWIPGPRGTWVLGPLGSET